MGYGTLEGIGGDVEELEPDSAELAPEKVRWRCPVLAP